MSRIAIARFLVASIPLVLFVSLVAACGSSTPTPVEPSAPGPTASTAGLPSATPLPAATTPSPSPQPTVAVTIKATAKAAGRGSIRVDGVVDAAGAALGGAPLAVTALPVDGVPKVVVLSGVVPEGARTAHVGVRVNTEGAGPGPANLTIYRASYSEGGGKNRVPNPKLRRNANHWGLHEDGIRVRRSNNGPGLMIRIVDTPTQATVINTGAVKVTPGAEYRATMLLKVPEASIGSAYFAVVFLGDTEIARHRVPLVPAPITLPDALSASDGRFEASFDKLKPGRYRVVVGYAGDAAHAPATFEQLVKVR